MSVSISAFRFGAVTTPPPTDTKAADSKARGAATEQAFLTEAQKSPAERMRERILKEMNLTEEDLAKLDDGKRAAIEEQIRTKLLEMARAAQDDKKPGLLADVTV